jgi:hypothetical protein
MRGGRVKLPTTIASKVGESGFMLCEACKGCNVQHLWPYSCPAVAANPNKDHGMAKPAALATQAQHNKAVGTASMCDPISLALGSGVLAHLQQLHQKCSRVHLLFMQSLRWGTNRMGMKDHNDSTCWCASCISSLLCAASVPGGSYPVVFELNKRCPDGHAFAIWWSCTKLGSWDPAHCSVMTVGRNPCWHQSQCALTARQMLMGARR